MLELGAGADILRSLGTAYIGLIIFLLIVALWLPKRRWQKVALVLIVLGVFTGPALLRDREQDKLIAERKARYEEAKALFDERCKTAGEKIYRTVEGVAGVIWMKWRLDSWPRDQYAAEDPYGTDCREEGCIYRLLRGNGAEVGFKNTNAFSQNGYRFVETVDPRDGIRYRYTGTFKSVKDVPQADFSRHVRSTGFGAEPDGRFFALQREPIEKFSANFGLEWEDVSTYPDRSHWIAGGSLKVFDIKKNELIAERTGFLMDQGQGSKDGQRDPWSWAKYRGPQCPSSQVSTVAFVTKILRPSLIRD
ncbi:MAG: hypothetical protein KKC79_11215 [Gammaproteobacteria bacterium]|nr:hypothetical protein [Gammaproteobacteria bacterium]MBU1441788.1 hypothetical protein [Gammaproteobacteria bacterium]MBU2288025.1 hypothetical protein [Gammaproteobacteria bacterium]MBU2409199.1 hypothetical protein [Gammaproteobacteria bacterium]